MDDVRVVDALPMIEPRKGPDAAWPFLQAFIIAAARHYDHWIIYSPSTGAAIACENAGQGMNKPAGPRRYFGLYEWEHHGLQDWRYRRVSAPQETLEGALLQMNVMKIEAAAAATDWQVDEWTPPAEHQRRERTIKIPGPGTRVPPQPKGRKKGRRKSGDEIVEEALDA